MQGYGGEKWGGWGGDGARCRRVVKFLARYPDLTGTLPASVRVWLVAPVLTRRRSRLATPRRDSHRRPPSPAAVAPPAAVAAAATVHADAAALGLGPLGGGGPAAAAAARRRRRRLQPGGGHCSREGFGPGSAVLRHLLRSYLTSYSVVCTAVRTATRHPTQEVPYDKDGRGKIPFNLAPPVYRVRSVNRNG